MSKIKLFFSGWKTLSLCKKKTLRHHDNGVKSSHKRHMTCFNNNKQTNMSKKTKQVVPHTSETSVPEVPKVKKPRASKVEVPLTPAQQAAKEAMEKANADAKAELIANAQEQLAGADAKIAAAKETVKAAMAERKALRKALGIKGSFGGAKANTFTFVTDYPEGKGAPQARQILEIVKASSPNAVSRADVVATMKTTIVTKMDHSKLLSYYASRMVADGVMSVA